MNINKLIKRIKEEIGLDKFLKLSYTDKDIYDIIETHALEEWSHYMKYQMLFDNITILPEHRIHPTLYQLPKSVTDPINRSGLDILALRARVSNNMYGEGINGVGRLSATYSDYMSFDQAFAGLSRARQVGGLDGYSNYLNSGYYDKPNRIRFNYNVEMYSGQTFEMRFFVSQPKNLLGISETREHDFFELCKLNVMIVLYNNEGKYIESISSGLGNVNLKIDDWANAASEKKELLLKLQNYSTLEPSATKVLM